MWAKEFTYPALAKFFQLILGFHSLGQGEPAPPILVPSFTFLPLFMCLRLFSIFQQEACHTVALHFTLKTILKAEEELWKFKYFTMQKYNLRKKILYKKPKKSFEIS
jgi:hypothetical protein